MSDSTGTKRDEVRTHNGEVTYLDRVVDGIREILDCT